MFYVLSTCRNNMFTRHYVENYKCFIDVKEMSVWHLPVKALK